MTFNNIRNDRGFTLIELLVVVLIIGILAAIAIPVFLGQQDQAKDAAAKSDLGAAKTALVSYALDHNGVYTTATPANIVNYGYAGSTGVTLTFGTVTNSAFCIQAVSAATPAASHTFRITNSTGITQAACP